MRAMRLIRLQDAYSNNEGKPRMNNTIIGFMFLFLAGFAQQSIATTSDGGCERLDTGDNFDDLNKILDCIESKITSKSSVTATNIAVYSEEKEPNDLIGNANIITLGTTVKGKVKEGNEFDIFRFTAPDSEKGIRIIWRQTNTSGFSPKLTLYDDAEVHLKTVEGYRHRTTSLAYKTEPQKTYYVYLTCRGNCTNNMDYELLVRAE